MVSAKGDFTVAAARGGATSNTFRPCIAPRSRLSASGRLASRGVIRTSAQAGATAQKNARIRLRAAKVVTDMSNPPTEERSMARLRGEGRAPSPGRKRAAPRHDDGLFSKSQNLRP